MRACRIGSSEQGTTLEITRLSGDTRQLWFPVRTLRPTVICFSFELPSVCAPRHDTFLFRRAALSARPLALPSCLSALSATWSIKVFLLRARLAPSHTMPSSTTSTSSSSSSHSSRGSGHHRSSSQRRSKAHHNLDRAAQEIEDDRTNYRIIRDGGWDNIHHFMLSYGLKPYDPDDYETAKVIIQGFRDRGYYRKSSGSSSSSSRR